MKINRKLKSFVITCQFCQWERFVTYSQHWNIKTGKSSANCKPCNIRLGVFKKSVPPKATKESQDKAAESRIGKKRSLTKPMLYRKLFAPETLSNEDMRKKQSAAKKGKFGPKANAWDGGKTSHRKLEMGRPEYKSLRKSCFERDHYKCQLCEKQSKNLVMDHILEWCNYPEKRFDLSNVRTLCDSCHRKTQNFSFKASKKGRQLCLFA